MSRAVVRLRRIYEKAEKRDGFRILVDRLWPRGMSRDKSAIELWLKDIAPSDELRKWFGHDPVKWVEFQRRYGKEIKSNKKATADLKKLFKREKVVTLVYSAADEKHNNAVALKNILKL